MKTTGKSPPALPDRKIPGWFYKFGRTLIAIVLLALAGAYDISVAEVSGDLRWIMIHATAMILLTAYFIACLRRCRNKTRTGAPPFGKLKVLSRVEGQAAALQNHQHETLLFRMPPSIWPVAFLAIWASLSMLWTLSPYHTWWSLKHLLGYLFLFYFVFILRSEKWYAKLLWVVALGMLFNSLIAIAQGNGMAHGVGDARLEAIFPAWKYITAGFSTLLRGFYRMTGTDKIVCDTLPFFHQNIFLDLFYQAAPPAGTQSNKNLLGSYLVLTLPAVFYLLLAGRNKSATENGAAIPHSDVGPLLAEAIRSPHGKRRRAAFRQAQGPEQSRRTSGGPTKILGFLSLNLPRILSAIFFVTGVIALLYTRSRASWLSAICVTIFFVSWIAAHRKHNGMIKSVFPGPFLVLTAVISAMTVFSLASGNRLGTHGLLERFQSIVRESQGARIAYDINALAMIRDRPLRGFGLGAFHTAYPAYYRAIRMTPPAGFSTYARPSRMHNDFGQTFVELGIAGGLAYLGIFLALLIMNWRIWKAAIANGRPPGGRILSLCLITGIVGLGINSLADFPMQLPLTPAIFWVFAGMLTGLYVMNVENNGIGPRKKIVIPRFVYVFLAILSTAACLAVFRDDFLRRKGAQYLKIAITLASAGRFDEQPLLFLRKSMSYYKWNVRLQEYRVLIYANYRGKIKVSTDERIGEVEDAIKYDPYSPHKLVNLGGLYITKARELGHANRRDEALKYAGKAGKISETMLEKYPGFFSDLVHTIGGLAQMLQGALQPAGAESHLNQAKILLEKALEINPRNEPAREALGRTEVLLKAWKL